MACSWRIRHKLMLGMFLVVAIMALLLGGTVHAIVSYRNTMRIWDSKLDELEFAYKLKDAINALSAPISDPSRQCGILLDRISPVQVALSEFRKKLVEIVDLGRFPDNGRRENSQIEAIEKDMTKLDKLLRSVGPTVREAGHPDLLEPQTPIAISIKGLNTDVTDLIGSITDELSRSVQKTRADARKSIMLLLSTGGLAMLLMAGLLRFFYRWVAQPIRDLELGVSRVARGDFEHRIEIKSGDEIEDLARAYNEMTDKLRAMYQNLAEQVNERSRQLVRSERLAGVGFLAAGVAHEINNPLAAIAFSSEALEGRLADLMRVTPMSNADKDTIAKFLKMIQEEAFRCTEITKKLLAFSRGGDLKREQGDVVNVVQSVLDIVQHVPGCKGKRVEFRASGPMLAWINSQEVKQVFLNLVINAMESMEEGGVLTISYTQKPGVAEIAFKDTGCGMTPNVLENIFEPFYTRSRTGKGTGLGLSISHRIITQHGGEIEATSDGPGKGSTFLVQLPTDAPANAEGAGKDVQDPVEEFLKLSNAKRNSRAA